MRYLVLVVSTFILPASATAQSTKACLAPPEAEALVTYALPSAIRAATNKCTPTLPATAALIQSGPIIAARYQIEADRAWPIARGAFNKAFGLDLTRALGEPAAKGLVDTAFGAALAENLNPEQCGKVDRLINILEPLPARNMAMLITALMEFGGVGKGEKSPLSLCPVPVEAK